MFQEQEHNANCNSQSKKQIKRTNSNNAYGKHQVENCEILSSESSEITKLQKIELPVNGVSTAGSKSNQCRK